MGKRIAFTVTFVLLLLLVSVESVMAISNHAYSNSPIYTINETINFTNIAYVNLTTNVTVNLTNTAGSVLYNYTAFNLHGNVSNFTTSLIANVSTGGHYSIVTSFAFNNTTYVTPILITITRASIITLSTNKPVYDPGEPINFTIQALDSNQAGVSGENMTVKLVYQNNYTILATYSANTSSSGEIRGTIRAPSTTGTYRIIVNDGVAVRIIQVFNFDLVAFTGDVNQNVKGKYGVNETVYVFADLFSGNKTRFIGSESITVNITWPNGTYRTDSLSYTITRVNTSFIADKNGTYSVSVAVVSNSISRSLSIFAGSFEIRASIESASRGTASTFFPNETAYVFVKVFNISSGQIMTTNFSAGIWTLDLLDSSFNFLNSISNTTTHIVSENSYRFSFNASSSVGIYYVRVKLNDTESIQSIDVEDTFAEATPVDKGLRFKNFFIGGKHTVRILTSLSNVSGRVNVSSISVLEVRNSNGLDIKDSLNITYSNVTYLGATSGLIEFPTPPNADWYVIRTLANNQYAASTWFFVKTYAVCSQMSGYKWFINSNESANLTVRVTSLQDVEYLETFGGKNEHAGEANSTSVGGTSFGSMYGVMFCTGGNASANVRVSVSKVFNGLTFEDVTSKLSSLPTFATDSDGNGNFSLTPPSGGWETGWYYIELDLTDSNNNTDKGYGSFNVKNLWINVWPKSTSGAGGSFWKWYFSPGENLTFDVYSYSSSNTWYTWSTQGVGDNCYLQDVFFNGNGAEWFWPPRKIEKSFYNWTCSGSSGIFGLNVSTDRNQFKSGYYSVRVKVNLTNGTGDTGDGWFNIKSYNVYVKNPGTNWYESWYRNNRDVFNFTIDVTYANSTEWQCSWSTCANRASGNLNITLKSIRKYDQWVAGEYSKTKYNVSLYNSTSQAYWSINTTNGTVNATFRPNGTWESGYYTAEFEVNGPEGSETGYIWYEIRPFFIDIFPVNKVANQTVYSFQTGQNITVNISAANKPGWMKYYYAAANYTYFNATIRKMELKAYLPGSWSAQNFSIRNYTPSYVNGSINMTITPSSTLQSGYYYLEVELADDQGNIASGTTWFEIRNFRISARISNWQYTFRNNQSIAIDVAVCAADTWWCNYDSNSYTGTTVNVAVTKVQKSDSWPYTNVGGWYSLQNTTASGTGKTTLNITPTTRLASGYYNAEIQGQNSDGSGSNESTSIWFQVQSFSAYAYATKWEFSSRDNVSFYITADQPTTIGAAQFKCGYWPSESTYDFNTHFTFNTTSLSAGSNVVGVSMIGTNKLKDGYCYGQITLRDPSDSSVYQSVYVYFSVRSISVSAFTVNWINFKNQTLDLRLTADRAVNISWINLTLWDARYVNSTTYLLNTDFTINKTSSITNDTISLNRTGANWTLGSYYGQLGVVDASDPNVQSTTWIYFYVNSYVAGYAYVVDPTNNYSYTIRPSNRTLTFRAWTAAYNSTTKYYDTKSGMTAEVIAIEKYDCSSAYCQYSNTSFINSTRGTSDQNGYTLVNITRETDWDVVGYYATIRITDPRTGEFYDNFWIWFWVSA